MAITDPTAVKFCNERVRVLADVLGQSYWSAKAFLAEWNSSNYGPSNLPDLIPNDTSLVVDGSATDGRKQITGALVRGIVAQAQAIVDSYEANGGANLNSVALVYVNGQSRF